MNLKQNKFCRLRNRMKSVLRGKKGFTFTELLVATLIMLLATGVLTSTLALAIRHFFLSTQRTEAQFLLGSLAEFVEDELSFSVDTDGRTDLAWSKGTHNMGSNIRFCVLPDGKDLDPVDYTCPDVLPVGNDILDPPNPGEYGKLVITGENYKKEGEPKYFKIVSDGAYDVAPSHGYSLKAAMHLNWQDPYYVVQIYVADQNGKELTKAEFTVEPAIVTP